MTYSIRRFVILVGLALLFTGCFGKFQVTRNLYAFNRTVSEDRFTRWALFLAMNIAPVYPVGTVMDAFIANPIEFWSGTNPVKDSERWFPAPQPQARLTPLPDSRLTPLPDGRVRMDLPEGVLYLRLAPDALLAFDERGELLARVSDVGGRAALVGGKLSEP